jgi:hypothetical protein
LKRRQLADLWPILAHPGPSFFLRRVFMKSYRPVLASFAILLCLLARPVQAVTCQNNISASNPDSAYTVHSDGTATHTRTGLMWKVCSEGQTWSNGVCTGSATKHTWANALLLAESTVYAGHSDWRQPNLKELRSLVEECRVNPSINDSVFPNTPTSYFWSGSPYAGSESHAWAVYFHSGYAYYHFRYLSRHLRLVRGGKVTISSPPPAYSELVDTYGFYDSDHAGQNTFDFAARINTFRYLNNTGVAGQVEVFAPNASAQGAITARTIDTGVVVTPTTRVCGWNPPSEADALGKCATYDVLAMQSLDVTIEDRGEITEGSYPLLFNFRASSPIEADDAEWRIWAFKYAYWRNFDTAVKLFMAEMDEVEPAVKQRQQWLDILDALLPSSNSQKVLNKLPGSSWFKKHRGVVKKVNQSQQIFFDSYEAPAVWDPALSSISTIIDGVISCVYGGCPTYAFSSFLTVLNFETGLYELSSLNRKMNALFITRELLQGQINDREDWLSDEQIIARASTIASSSLTDCRWYQTWFFTCGLASVEGKDVIHQYRLHQLAMQEWIMATKQDQAPDLDLTADDLIFPPKTGQQHSQLLVSGPAKLTGVTPGGPIRWAAIGGDASVSNNPLMCGTTWSASGVAMGGQYLCLRTTTPSTWATGKSAYLVMGANTSEFHVSTRTSSATTPTSTQLALSKLASGLVVLRADVFASGGSTLGGAIGTVVFRDGNRFLGTASTVKDSSSLPGSRYAAIMIAPDYGAHQFAAEYIGGGDYQGSVSKELRWTKSAMPAGVLQLLLD